MQRSNNRRLTIDQMLAQTRVISSTEALQNDNYSSSVTEGFYSSYSVLEDERNNETKRYNGFKNNKKYFKENTYNSHDNNIYSRKNNLKSRQNHIKEDINKEMSVQLDFDIKLRFSYKDQFLENQEEPEAQIDKDDEQNKIRAIRDAQSNQNSFNKQSQVSRKVGKQLNIEKQHKLKGQQKQLQKEQQLKTKKLNSQKNHIYMFDIPTLVNISAVVDNQILADTPTLVEAFQNQMKEKQKYQKDTKTLSKLASVANKQNETASQIQNLHKQNQNRYKNWAKQQNEKIQHLEKEILQDGIKKGKTNKYDSFSQKQCCLIM